MDFNSIKKAKPEVVFTKKNIPFVEKEIMFQGKPTKVWQANCSQGDASFSFFIKSTPKGKYKTTKGGNEIGYYMTMTMFDNHGANNNNRR